MSNVFDRGLNILLGFLIPFRLSQIQNIQIGFGISELESHQHWTNWTQIP